MNLRKTISKIDKNAYKRTFVLIFVATTCFGEISCVLKSRINDGESLRDMREIRKAQEIFYKNFNKKRYASLTELKQNNLISEALADGINNSYKFEVLTAESHYTLRVSPVKDSFSSQNAGSCFFMDESGVIRTSYNPNVLADEKSEAIKSQ
jgi:hypothetical protein